MDSTDNLIENHVKKAKNGSILFPEVFSAYGSTGAINISLHRMVKRGLLLRVAHGVYAKPKTSKLIGDIKPSLDDIAKAIANRDKVRIIPTGSFALYALGLSTQIPLNVVYLTDGSPRSIKVGNGKIKFKKTSPKILSAKSPRCVLVIQALKEIGNDHVTADEETKIIAILKEEDRTKLKHDIALAPRWVGEIMAKAL
jgi:hypothetical protein